MIVFDHIYTYILYTYIQLYVIIQTTRVSPKHTCNRTVGLSRTLGNVECVAHDKPYLVFLFIVHIYILCRKGR